MKIREVRYFWDGKQDRHYYQCELTYDVMSLGGTQFSPKSTVRVLATVTRDTKTKSPTFNRWFASLRTGLKSEPLMSLGDAKAWAEVVERMNRK